MARPLIHGVLLLLPLIGGCHTAASRQITDAPRPANQTASDADPVVASSAGDRVHASSRRRSVSRTAQDAQADSTSLQLASHRQAQSDEGAVAGIPTTPADGTVDEGRTDVAAASAATQAVPYPYAISLAEALEMGLTQNPDLNTQRQQAGVSTAALGVAQTYPFNPFIQVQATPGQWARDGGPGSIYHYVLLMQTIQLAHQQQFREEAACASLNSVNWTIHQNELVNVAQTERLYFTALYLKGVYEVTRQNAASNLQMLAVLEKRLNAGEAAAADVAIVRLDARATRQQAQLAEANFQTALLDLRRQLNIAPEMPLDVAGELSDWHWRAADVAQLGPYLDTDLCLDDSASLNLAQTLAAGRPDVMAAHADVDTARANADLANASRTPDLQLGPYYQRTDSGTSYLGFRAQMDLPVVNNGVPLLRQRQAEWRQRVTAWHQLRTRAGLEAQAAIERYERARRIAALARSDFAMSLPEELQHLEAQFLAGEVDVLRIFQSRNSLLQNRRAYLDILNEAALAAAVVTQSTGVPPHALVERETPDAREALTPAPTAIDEQAP